MSRTRTPPLRCGLSRWFHPSRHRPIASTGQAVRVHLQASQQHAERDLVICIGKWYVRSKQTPPLATDNLLENTGGVLRPTSASQRAPTPHLIEQRSAACTAVRVVTARVALRCGGMQCGRATLQTRARVTRCSSMAYKRYAAQIGCLATAVHSAPPHACAC